MYGDSFNKSIAVTFERMEVNAAHLKRKLNLMGCGMLVCFCIIRIRGVYIITFVVSFPVAGTGSGRPFVTSFTFGAKWVSPISPCICVLPTVDVCVRHNHNFHK